MTAHLDFLLEKSDQYDEFFVEGGSIITGFGARREIRKLAAKMPPLHGDDVAEFLEQCTSPGRRMLALEWLQADGPAEAVRFLARCLDKPPFIARSLAASTLASIGSDEAKGVLESAYKRTSDWEIRQAIERALAQFSYPIIPTRVRRAFADSETRNTAIEALSNIASYDATDLLLEALQDKDKRSSDAAFEALVEREDERIAPALITMLTAGRAQTKKQAARLLGCRKEALALRALSELCKTAKARDLRMTAGFALGMIGNTEAIPALVDRLFDPDEHIMVSTAACISLGKVGDPAVLEPLRRVIDERKHGRGWADLPIERDIYCAAIDGISRLPVPGVPDILIELLESRHEYDRAEAAQCLGRLKHVAALPALEKAAAAPAEHSESRERIEKVIERLAKLA
jgi:HEAT repeat protein